MNNNYFPFNNDCLNLNASPAITLFKYSASGP